jgi:hypothetical protein
MSCGRNCQPHWDVRVCCEAGCPSKNSQEMLYNCPQRFVTAKWQMLNDADLHTRMENGDYSFVAKGYKCAYGGGYLKWFRPKEDADEIKLMVELLKKRTEGQLLVVIVTCC